MDSKPNLKWYHILNMSVGFFGIQHGFEIQFARMSSIYEMLGAKPDQIPLLWLAAPLTGLIVQPIIGYMSDRTWITPFQMRRRPYFLIGAVLASIALIFMPSCSTIWMAAGLLWILDASLNISMEPFRAFVADNLNSSQRPTGFAMQTIMIGLGTIFAQYLCSIDFFKVAPWMKNFFSNSMSVAFYLCASIYIISILYTVFTTKEYPPSDEELQQRSAEKKSFFQVIKEWFLETKRLYINMPKVMRELAPVQFFTWMGLFCMWMYYSVAVARYVFGATDPNSLLYQDGIRWSSHTMMVKGIITPLFALAIPFFVRHIGTVKTHFVNLLITGIGLLMIPYIKSPHMLYIPMIAAGIGWASITSLPYVILADHIPEKCYGIYMGIFNMFIVIPEILISIGFGKIITTCLKGNMALAVAFGGLLLIIAAIFTLLMLRRDKIEEVKI